MKVLESTGRVPVCLTAFLLACLWAVPQRTAAVGPVRSDSADRLCLLLADNGVHRSFVPPRLPRASLTATPAPSTSVVGVAYDGFASPAQAAFQYAVDLWAAQLNSPVPIAIDAHFFDLGPGVLATTATSGLFRDFPGGLPGTYYPVALANRLSGVDLDPGGADLVAYFNSRVNWYFGLDGNTPPDTYDFVTAVLHELAHGFGFFGSGWMTANLQGTWGFGSANSGGVFPSIYDRFVVNGSGQAFLNTALFPNPSAALALQITGGNLFFNGANTRAMNFNMAARLYAPPAWASLASYSHLSELAYTTGDANSLMTPLLSLGEAVHEPGGIVQGMFRDMGWSVNGSSCAYALGRTPSSFGAGGGTGTVNLGTGNNCVWTMSSNAPWLTFTSSTTGTGTTSVGFSVAANTSSVARLATISAGGESITVSQAGVGCAFTVGSNLLTFGVHGGSRSLPVTATAQDCAFTASTSVPWLTITGNRIGSSTLTIQATLSGSATRTATLNVAGTTVAVRQNGDSSSTFDIDDDGAADVLAYDPASGSRFFAAANPRDLGFTASTDALWAAGWSVYPGDFNGDRRGDLFFYNKATGRALKAIATGTETFSYTEFPWSPDWEITVADFNGDGADDVLTYNATTGRWFRCTSLPNGTFRFSEPGLWSPNWSIYPADFNGDGRADLFLYNATNDVNRGRWYRAVSNADESFGFIAGEIVWANNWTITPGDFNGDGRTDLFLYRSSGEWYRVFFTATGTNYETGLWSPDWTLSRGDFNGDARTDLFVYNSTTGRWFVVISEANGSLSYHGGTVNWSAGWQISVTDIDVDGRADLVLYNPVDGRWFQAITRAPGVFTFANGTWPTGLQIIATRPQPR